MQRSRANTALRRTKMSGKTIALLVLLNLSVIAWIFSAARAQNDGFRFAIAESPDKQATAMIIDRQNGKHYFLYQLFKQPTTEEEKVRPQYVGIGTNDSLGNLVLMGAR